MAFGLSSGANVVEIVLRAKDEASRTIEKTSQGLDIFGRKFAITSAAMAAGGAAITAGLISMANKSAAAAGGVHDMSLKLGISAEKTQVLRHAAEQTGTSLEAFPLLFKTIASAADEAARGNDRYGEAFGRLGVDVTDSAGKVRPIYDLFADVSGALSRFGDSAEGVSIGTDLMGRGFMQLRPLLAEGPGALQKYEASLRDMGALMSGEQIRAAEAYGDSIVDLRVAFDAARNTVANALIPTLDDYIKKTIIPGTAAVSEFIAAHQNIPKVAFDIGAIGLAAGTAGLGVAGLARAFTAFGPAGWIAAGIAAATGGLIALRNEAVEAAKEAGNVKPPSALMRAATLRYGAAAGGPAGAAAVVEVPEWTGGAGTAYPRAARDVMMPPLLTTEQWRAAQGFGAPVAPVPFGALMPLVSQRMAGFEPFVGPRLPTEIPSIALPWQNVPKGTRWWGGEGAPRGPGEIQPAPEIKIPAVDIAKGGDAFVSAAESMTAALVYTTNTAESFGDWLGDAAVNALKQFIAALAVNKVGGFLKGLLGFQAGGIVPAFLHGGMVPMLSGASPYRDSVMIAATPGEAVLPRGLTQELARVIGGGGAGNARTTEPFSPSWPRSQRPAIINIHYPAYQSHVDRVDLARDVKYGLDDVGVAGLVVEP